MLKFSLDFIYFGIAGTLGYIVDVVVLYLVMDSLGLYFGRVVSFLFAVTTTWIFNRHITFRKRPSRVSLVSEYRTYFSFMLVGGLVNYFVYFVTLQIVAEIPPYMAVAIGGLSGLSTNYFLSRNLLFKDNL